MKRKTAARGAAGKTPPTRGINEGLKRWHRAHKDDADYRAARAEGSRRHLEQLYRDAELGRLARKFLAGIGDVLVRLAALKSEADGIAAARLHHKGKTLRKPAP